jgi:hypothetical protein
VVEPAEIRAVALSLPRTDEHLIRGRVKYRVGRLVYLALSRDGTELGLAFPKEERAALIASAPESFFLPIPSELRFNWVESYLSQLDVDEMTELVTDAWRMVVPRRVALARLGPDATP